MADDFEDLLMAYELRASLQNADWDWKVCRAWRVETFLHTKITFRRL